MTAEEYEARFAELLADNARQAKALQHGALLLQVARDERDVVSQTLREVRTELDDLKASCVDSQRLTAVAVEEFGCDIERYRGMVGDRDAEIERWQQGDVEHRARRFDLNLEIDRLRAELRRYTELPLDSPYRSADMKERLDALWKENEMLGRKVVDAEALRDHKIAETARLTERWHRLGNHLAGMRRATNALAREVGVLRQKIAQDEHFHGMFLGDVDKAIAEALKASQDASENGSRPSSSSRGSRSSR